MSGEIFSSAIARTFQRTLDAIITDKSDGYSDTVLNEYFDMDPMDKGISDHYENAGPGLATSKTEGAEVSMGTIREGFLQRYIPKTYALKLVVTEEAAEDCLYPEALSLARRLKRSIYLAAEYDAGLVPARGWNTSYVGPDSQPLFSTAHVLPSGATASNTLSVPIAPSVQALIVVRAALKRQVGHDGFISPLDIEKVVCTPEQWGAWQGIINSEKRPDSGNFAEINVVRKFAPDLVEVPFWTNTTTNWFVKTNADRGMLWRWRRKPRSSSWVDNDNGVMKYKVDARWTRAWTDWRGVYGSQA